MVVGFSFGSSLWMAKAKVFSFYVASMPKKDMKLLASDLFDQFFNLVPDTLLAQEFFYETRVFRKRDGAFMRIGQADSYSYIVSTKDLLSNPHYFQQVLAISGHLGKYKHLLEWFERRQNFSILAPMSDVAKNEFSIA